MKNQAKKSSIEQMFDALPEGKPSGEIKASPRNEFLGTIADGLNSVVNAKPLEGLIAGEIIKSALGGTASLIDDVSYQGLGALLTGGNAATGGMGTINIDPRAVELALNIIPVGSAAKEGGKVAAKQLGPKAAEMAENYMRSQGLIKEIMADSGKPNNSKGPIANKAKKSGGPTDDELEEARKNAVKMLGLPENNTAKDRAESLGKYLDVYHGSPESKITAFSDSINPVFTSQDKNYSAAYADKGQKNKGRVYDLKLRYNNMFDSNNPEHLAIYNEEFLPFINKFYQRQNKKPATEFKGGELVHFHDADYFYRYLKGQMARGRQLPFDAVPVNEGGFGELYSKSADISYFPLEASQLRLKNAAFDPARVNENNLLASRLLPLALPGLLYEGEEE